MNVRRWLFAVIQLAGISAGTGCWAQAQTENPIWKPCPHLPYVPIRDSVALQRSVDSLANCLPGRWELVEIAGGWGPNYKPNRVVEVVIDPQRAGKVYENGVEVATFQLTLQRRLETVRFRISQQGETIFKLRLRPDRWGLLGLCDDKLVFSNGRGDGDAYAFRRVVSKN